MTQQTILVTGAGRGLGAALARRCAEAGHAVIAGCRDPEAAGALADQPGIEIVRLDLRTPFDLAPLAERLAERPLDVLVNNAGTMGEDWQRQGIGGKGDDETWLRAFETNAIGPFRVVETALPALRRGTARTIVNVSSVVSSLTRPPIGGLYTYRSSKAALNAITVGLHLDLAADGFCVVALHPGLVQTRMGGPDATYTPDESAALVWRTIEGLGPTHSGRFLNLDGTLLDW